MVKANAIGLYPARGGYAHGFVTGDAVARGTDSNGFPIPNWNVTTDGNLIYEIIGPAEGAGGAVGVWLHSFFRGIGNLSGVTVSVAGQQVLIPPGDNTQVVAAVGDTITFAFSQDFSDVAYDWDIEFGLDNGVNLTAWLGAHPDGVQIVNPLPPPGSESLWVWAGQPQSVAAEVYWADGPLEANKLQLAHSLVIDQTSGSLIDIARQDFNGAVSPPMGATHLLLEIDQTNQFNEIDESDNVTAREIVPFNIALTQLTADADDHSKLALEYYISGTAPQGGFQVDFFDSSDDQFDPGIDIPLASPITISPEAINLAQHLELKGEPATEALTPNVSHTLLIDPTGLSVLSALEDKDVEYVIAVADPNDDISESDTDPFNADNTVQFAGIFHAGAGSPAVVRTFHNAGDAVQIHPNGQPMPIIAQSGPVQFVTALTAMPSHYLVVTGDESDLLWADPLETKKIIGIAGDGDDVFSGASGDDLLKGGDGRDVLIGDAFDLTFGQFVAFAQGIVNGTLGSPQGLTPVGGGVDLLEGGDENDILIGGGGMDTLKGEGGHSILFGDAFSMAAGDQFNASSLFYNPIEFGSPEELFAFADNPVNEGFRLFAMATLTAPGATKDIIFGGDGADFVVGGAGNDEIYTGGGSLAVVFGNEGVDEVHSSSNITVAFGGDEKDFLFGGNRHDFLVGGPGDDEITTSGEVFNLAIGDDYTFGVVAPTNWNDLFNAWTAGKVDSSLSATPAGNGEDILFAGAGSDVLIGGDGNDTFKRSADDNSGSANVIFGDELRFDSSLSFDFTSALAGNVPEELLLRGVAFLNQFGAHLTGSGDDEIEGGTGSHFVFAGAGDDWFLGDEGRDGVFGQNGLDILSGGKGSDALLGGDNNDVLLGDGFTVSVPLIGEFIQALKNYQSTSKLLFGFDLLPQAGAKDVIRGGDGHELIIGGTGDDIIEAEQGNALILGDSFSITAGVEVDVTSAHTLSGFVAAMKLLGSIQLADSGKDQITGGEGSNLIIGGNETDTIVGSLDAASVNLMFGNDGIDTITGRGGYNLIVGGDDRDILHGGDKANAIFGDSIQVNLNLNFDLQNLFTGNNIVSVAGASLELTDTGNDDIHGGDGFDFIVGGEGEDVITGGDGTNVVFSDTFKIVSDALDLLMKLVNPIPLTTTLAAAKLLVTTAYDFFFGAEGNASQLRDTYTGGVHTDVFFGGGGPDFADGGAGCDLLVGGIDNDNFLRAEPGPSECQFGFGTGRVIAFGGPGDDTMQGGNGNDILFSTLGSDTFYGGGGDDLLGGGDGNDELYGEAGNDTLYGESGADLLDGGPGTDRLYGGPGQNSFFNGTPIDNRSGPSLIEFAFGVPATVVGAGSLNLFNHSTETSIDVSSAPLLNNGTSTITWDLTGFVLPDSRYTAELPADQVTAGGGGQAGPTQTIEFHVLRGDVNGDGRVNASDFIEVDFQFDPILGDPFRYGDVNGDGVVNASDFVHVDANFNPLLLPLLEVDFGDAPEVSTSFPTTLASDGARHVVTGNTLILGTDRDAEADGQPDATASGDGADEDGIILAGGLITGTNVAVTLTSSGAGFVDGWIDFNQDGDWDDPGEQVFSDEAVGGGANNLQIAVPAGATLGSTFARFRLTAAAGYSYTGLAPMGEVEDYQLTIADSPPESADNLIEERLTTTAGRFVLVPWWTLVPRATSMHRLNAISASANSLFSQQFSLITTGLQSRFRGR